MSPSARPPSFATLSITALTANAMAPTKIGRPDEPCTNVAPVSAMIEPVAGVVRFGDDRVEGGAIKRRVHLVGDLHQAAIEHGQRYGIERPRHRFPAVRLGFISIAA